jgi:hypothetical protein
METTARKSAARRDFIGRVTCAIDQGKKCGPTMPVVLPHIVD